MNNETMSEADKVVLDKFLANPTYKKMYEEAPEGAKRYYLANFKNSLAVMADGKDGISNFDEENHKILLSLSDEDWEYMKSHAPNATIGCGLHVTQQAIKKEKQGAVS